MIGRRWPQALACLGGIACLSLQPRTADAAEIATFRLEDVDGHVSLRYVSDASATDAGGGPASSGLSQRGWRNEIFVMTHSYVFHPNFLTLDIGGGPILYGESVSGSGSGTAAHGTLFNFSGRATLLRDKPYRASLFFEQLNPTVSIAPGQVLMQENTRYGADLSLLAPATPIPLQLGFSHAASQGRGNDRLIDDDTDRLTLGASRTYGTLGATQFHFQSLRQSSRSGSLNLPIQTSRQSNEAYSFDTRLQFGSDRQYDLSNLVSFNNQRYAVGGSTFPDLQDRRLMLDLRARHSERVHTHGSYSWSRNTQGDIDIALQNIAAGMSYRPAPGTQASLNLRADDSDTLQFLARSRGFDAAVQHDRPLLLGTGQAGYAIRHEQRSQQALAAQAEVLGERLTLAGTAYAKLGQPRIAGGSIVISNAVRSQTYVAGIDYLVSVVGLDTRIQRLVGGAILDGEEVLADYVYDVGGTYAYRQLDQTLNLGWRYGRYLGVFFRHATAMPRLASGTPTFALNEVRSSSFGANADLPFNPGFAFTLGGSFEYEVRRESIAPYRRAIADFHVQTDEPLLGLGYFRLTGRRSHTDYGDPAMNADVRGYDLRYWSRRWFGTDLTAALTGEQDRGGLLQRSRVDGSLGLQWQERKFSLTSSLVRSRETQGGYVRSRTLFQFLARRSF
ncbi:MAG: hypothetical protein RBS28_03700 [Rhodocyclaceae bacterium]|nr:hypothetical protein [Rhodocyclaceae bacterium]